MTILELVGFPEETAKGIASLITQYTPEFGDGVQCCILLNEGCMWAGLAARAKFVIRLHDSDLEACDLVRQIVNDNPGELEKFGLRPENIQVQGVFLHYKK